MAHQSRSLCFPSRLSLVFIFHSLKQASLNAVPNLTFDNVTSQTGMRRQLFSSLSVVLLRIKLLSDKYQFALYNEDCVSNMRCY